MAQIIMPIVLDLSNVETPAILYGEEYEIEQQEPFEFHLKWDLSGVKAADLSGVLFGDSDSASNENLFFQANSCKVSGENTDLSGVNAFVHGLLKPLKVVASDLVLTMFTRPVNVFHKRVRMEVEMFSLLVSFTIILSLVVILIEFLSEKHLFVLCLHI